MKKLMILAVTIVALSACSANSEFNKQKLFIENQMQILDTVSNFKSLMAFEENFMRDATQFEGSEKISQSEQEQIHAMLDKLSAQMRQKAMQIFPAVDSLPEEIVDQL